MRNLKRVLPSCLAVVGLILGATSPASATLPGDNGRILYWSYREDLSFQGYRTILPDGTGRRPAGVPNEAFEPVWSPDASSVAYSTGDRASTAIVILDPETQAATEVATADDFPADLEFVSGLAFSPSGDHLVAAAFFESAPTSRLFTLGTDGSDVTMISGDRRLSSPDWSSTDRIVAAMNTRRPRLFTMDPDGSDVELVVRLPRAGSRRAVGLRPSWAPDGGSIAFLAHARRVRSDVWTIDADGTDLRRVTDTPKRWEWTAVFAPEGDAIAFARSRGRGYWDFNDIWLVPLGEKGSRVTDSPLLEELITSWQPA